MVTDRATLLERHLEKIAIPCLFIWYSHEYTAFSTRFFQIGLLCVSFAIDGWYHRIAGYMQNESPRKCLPYCWRSWGLRWLRLLLYRWLWIYYVNFGYKHVESIRKICLQYLGTPHRCLLCMDRITFKKSEAQADCPERSTDRCSSSTNFHCGIYYRESGISVLSVNPSFIITNSCYK